MLLLKQEASPSTINSSNLTTGQAIPIRIMTLAIIRAGGKQYLVKRGDKIKIEKIEGDKGKEINFTDVLLFQDDKKVEIGKPMIKDAKVVAEILEQGKGDKIIIFKYKSKKRYKKKAGHRQLYTEIKIKDILLSSKKSVG